MKLANVTLNKETYVIDIVYVYPVESTILIVICDLQTDIPYFKWTVTLTPSSAVWIAPLNLELNTIVRQSKHFPGFTCKIYKNNRLEQVDNLRTSSLPFEYMNYMTDGIDCVGNSYIDFFYGSLCNGINFDGVVIDAGANVGLFTLLAKRNGAKRIYSIEPDRHTFFYLEKNFRTDSSVVLINKALTSNENGTTFYYNATTSVGNRTNVDATDVTDYVEDYVPSISLESILKLEEVVNLVKLDIEGSEFEVFDQLSTTYFEKVNQFFIEFHNVSTVIKNKLMDNGFTVEYRNSNENDTLGFIYAYK
jgi:FkbM family methyltransferase